MKAVFFVVLFGVALLFVGCFGEDCPECAIKYSHFLVNATNGSLHYEARCYSDSLTFVGFNATLFPNDTLLLYWERPMLDGVYTSDSTFFVGPSEIVLEAEDGRLLLFPYDRWRDTYNNNNFVRVEIDGNNVHWYWTIDSAYIADNYGRVSWEEFIERREAMLPPNGEGWCLIYNQR